MNRFKTDFLCASASFLSGFGSVMDIQGGGPICNLSDDPDSLAIAMDWSMVGQDIDDALRNAEAEFAHPVSQK